MKNHAKLQIYKGMLQYLLDETGYSLKQIADLSRSHVSSLRAIHHDGVLPETFKSEIQLISLYQFILEIRMEKTPFALAG